MFFLKFMFIKSFDLRMLNVFLDKEIKIIINVRGRKSIWIKFWMNFKRILIIDWNEEVNVGYKIRF